MIPSKPLAPCPVCGGLFRTTRDGKTWRHGSKDKTVWPPQDCAGSGQPAAPEPTRSTR